MITKEVIEAELKRHGPLKDMGSLWCSQDEESYPCQKAVLLSILLLLMEKP